MNTFLLCILFALCLFIHKACSPVNSPSLENCLIQSAQGSPMRCCFVDGPTPTCQSYNAVPYKQLRLNFNDSFDLDKATNIEQVYCGTEDEKCLSLLLEENSRSKCTDSNFHSESNKCCFVTVGYKYNSNSFCYPAPKNNIAELESLVENLKFEYFGAQSVSIDCAISYMTINIALIGIMIGLALI